MEFSKIENEKWFWKNHQILFCEIESEMLISELQKYAMERYDCKLMFACYHEREKEYVCCISYDRKIRALEILEGVMDPFGMTKGDASYAKNELTQTLLQAQIEEYSASGRAEYFMQKIEEYYIKMQEIYAGEYGVTHLDEIIQLPVYQKKKIPWGYVKTTDIAAPGEKICIHTLENDTGTTIVVDENTYIMIGCKGEVYDIRKEKFENSYVATSEKLDIFEMELEYIPTVDIVSSGENVSIDENACLCYPKPGGGIYAQKLFMKTKVYIKDSDEYFIGQTGDYMAIRLDDPTDIYIIQGDIFLMTYEEKDR